MRVRMSVARCCCYAGWTDNTHLIQLWWFRSDNFGTQEIHDPIFTNTFSQFPGPSTGAHYYESPDNPGIEYQLAIGVSSPGIPAASSARLRLTTFDPGPSFEKYVTANVWAFYVLDTWFAASLAKSQLKWGQLIPWSWPYGVGDHTVDLTPLLDAMQADPAYLPGDDFHMILLPADYLPQPISSGHPWGQAPDPFAPTHFETTP